MFSDPVVIAFDIAKGFRACFLDRTKAATFKKLGLSDPDNVSDQMNFGVANRKVYQTAGQGTPYQWTYGVKYVSPQGYKVTINNPDGTKTERSLHRGGSGLYGFEDGLTGMAYEERGYDSAGTLSQKN